MTYRPTLGEPITIAEWWKNRRGESIRVTISREPGLIENDAGGAE
jgi:hypothetical protein